MIYIAIDGTTHSTLEEAKQYNREIISGYNS
jgi:hypothetical protein